MAADATSAAHDRLNRRIVRCARCPRLIEHCRRVAQQKRASYRAWTYWGRPVPNFGDPRARVLIVGLAPAAHGANRTGRMFTGDRSGDFLYTALHEAGFANQPQATSADDGLALTDCLITAAAHCAPPANKPTRQELDNCSQWLDETFDLLGRRLRVVVCLGRIGHDEVLRLLKRHGAVRALADHPFDHGAAHGPFALRHSSFELLDTYHPSQQNTFTGRLTPAMLADVFRAAAERLQ